jgi:acetoin utilization deacetylase AcuC-like enzyme
VPQELLNSIHSAKYLEFLQTYASSLKDSSEYRYPSVFQLRSCTQDRYTTPLVRQGFYSFDMYTPVMKHTFNAALGSANCAYEVAVEVKENGGVAYALCRPPGHHAEYDQMGGYCYINNAAVAAQYLSQSGKVVSLDVDFHHGNGTQHIFEKRSDVLTISIHADPDWKFPHFSGYADETGVGDGVGFNINYPLLEGTDDKTFDQVLVQALTKIQKFQADYLVVSFGADTHVTDPIGGFRLTTEYFTRMARRINEIKLPTVIVQEGGYNTGLLGENVVAFLKRFER